MHIVIAQIRPRKADYAENLRRIAAALAQAGALKDPPGLVVFGETALTGYYLEGGVREAAVSAGTLYRDLAAHHGLSGAPPLDVCVGFYERFRGRIFNSALYATLGGPDAGIRHVHRKVFLPTYGVFDEERFVDAGRNVQAFDTAWGRVAMLVCEDSWHSASATVAALDGAQLILIPSASPARGVHPSGQGRSESIASWERVVRRIAEEHGIYVALAQIVGFEGGKGIQGASSLTGPDGTILAAAPMFEPALLLGAVDQRALLRARHDQPMLADLEVALPSLLRHAGDLPREPLAYDPAVDAEAPIRRPERASHTVTTATPAADPLAIDADLVARWLVAFLREDLSRRRFTKGVVGLSGGVDSAVTAALAVQALGPENMIAVFLPYRTSSSESRKHAELVAKKLKLDLQTIDITAAVDGLFDAAGEEPDPARRGNAAARMRMIALFDLSARHGALPLGTGNKSERLLGYFTWHADDAPPVNPIGDLFKTQVWALARHLGVPDEVVNKPATADLVHGQTDEEDLGISYGKADVILHWLLKGLEPNEIRAMGFSESEVSLVHGRLASTHWKRRLPTVAMLSNTAIGESYLRPVDY